METKNVWKEYSEERIKECEEFCRGYMDFLSQAKTERECAEIIKRDIESRGYKDIGTLAHGERNLKPGDKVYRINRGKSVVMFNIGDEPVENGMNILGAHIDSPRLDVKQNPMYEDGGFCYLDTHYYGGIKKYQWVTIPLALHGVFVKKDGTKVNIAIGEDDSDPVFFISDLLPHLAMDQMNKKAYSVVEGEALDLIVGNRPFLTENDEYSGETAGSGDDGEDNEENEENEEGEEQNRNNDKKEKGTSPSRGKKDRVKKGILAVLKEKYGVEEEDFLSAELEIVPAGRAREAGLDRSMILSYGQDDRVCAYASYKAMLDTPEVGRTSCCILADKEEIGSVGATGMQSRFFENTVAEVLGMLGHPYEISLRRCLENSNMLSSDVSSGYDPMYAQNYDLKNAAKLGCGMVFNKFTGARGKSGSNDADAEYLAMIRDIFEKDNVNFQTAELGKVDIGGGGTIAYILALYGMNVVDSGVAVLSMHAPWETVSKADVYETKRGYETFLKRAVLPGSYK